MGDAWVSVSRRPGRAGGGRCRARAGGPVLGGGRRGWARDRGGRKERKKGGKERKEEKGKREKEKEKEIKEKKMGGRERKKERGAGRDGAVRTSGDGGRGRPRVASPRGCGPRGTGTRPGREGRKKERGGKEGAGFAAAGRDASRWMGKDGTRIEFGCRVGQEKNSVNRVQGLRGVELNEKQL